MEDVVSRDNLWQALKRVEKNKGKPGPDGLGVAQLREAIRSEWPAIRERLLDGSYRPQPVRRVHIPKPDGGSRKLGIPSVMDRLISQAMLQVLQPIFDPTFSEKSYGYRPGRSAHQAVCQVQRYLQAGNRWLVDIDLESFFDRVNHDKLLGKMAKVIEDKRILRVIRAYLVAGIMEGGVTSPSTEGMPQGSPLSPLLSNIVLDDLDRELERRIAPENLRRLKKKVREKTRRNRGLDVECVAQDLSVYLRGWIGYFRLCQTPTTLRNLDSWIRRRFRSLIWTQWKRGRTRFRELRGLGISKDLAAQAAGSPHGPWRISRSPALNYAFPNDRLETIGLIRLLDYART